MKLWLISQTVNTGYDTYDSAVVAAASEDDARRMNPDGPWENRSFTSWAYAPEQVSVKFIGDAAHGVEPGIVLASFNAG